MKRYIGIDPGAAGGLAFITEDGLVVVHSRKSATPLEAVQDALLGTNPNDCVAYLEQIGGFIAGRPLPGSSMFKMGHSVGYWEGLLAGLGVRTILVRPQKWQEGIPGATGKKGPDRKRVLRDEAVRRFPAMRPTLLTCDALLIADFARTNERAAA